MGKVAFLFVGQGAQTVGMGQDLYENHPKARAVFERADQILGEPLAQLCFNGPKEQLDQTEYTQPAILTVSIAGAEALTEAGISPDFVAGLSLGEYAALVTGKVLDFSQALQLVRKRGRFMQEAVPLGQGGMTAILGLEAEKIQQACEEVKSLGLVQIANYNCPGQIVISGEKASLKAAAEKAISLGAKRAIPLEVSGPFHTPLLRPAAERLAAELSQIPLTAPKVPIFSNVTAQLVESAEEVKELLPRQVMSPVKWEMSIRHMQAAGVDTYVEIGPGSSLRGFVKKIDRQARLLHVEDLASLQETIATLS